ncbi:hypothetical protein L3V77_20190 [Vibrio sp. DW001]|uniref:hypothetical protein n=1 Tax=Vibrio sp. DW001 TaxID=2912315 RepID=UPI0023AFF850|nr:hypothetical protein [Vibrio sp. DW001]WED29733.1 hypothetical protein L3V77_20190 [Vibrio sp. DW001]
MNKLRLKAAERDFLLQFPQGFSDPEMAKIAKKHRVPQMIEQCQGLFSAESFSKPQLIAENMIKVISRSSMVSLFEKPKLRDWVKGMTHDERESYAYALKDMLHGDQEYGFNIMGDLLRPARLAKWSLMTIIPNYYAPLDEVFVKPTTAKGVIKYFELKDLEYKPTPSYEFYVKYRSQIIEMRGLVDDSLKPNNAAFCGFLMMTTSQ